VHLICHAFLRLGQYLKAPNMIHDSHREGHAHHIRDHSSRRGRPSCGTLYAASLHRLRLDDRIDADLRAGAVRWLRCSIGWTSLVRRTLSFEEQP
jgi:hypothetical protein